MKNWANNGKLSLFPNSVNTNTGKSKQSIKNLLVFIREYYSLDIRSFLKVNCIFIEHKQMLEDGILIRPVYSYKHIYVLIMV